MVKTKRGDTPTYSFKADDGQWYGCGFDDPVVGKGDEVEFEFESTRYGNKVLFDTFHVTKKAAGSTGGGKPASAAPFRKPFGAPQGASRPFPIPLLHGDRSIVRQNSVTNAVKLVEILTVDGETDKLTAEQAVAAVLKIARQFEAYSAGDVERMAAEDVHKEKA